MMDIATFVRERNEALLSLDREKINAYCRKYGAPEMPDTVVGWAGIHKARTAIRDFPPDEVEKSIRWLAEHGMSHMRDLS